MKKAKKIESLKQEGNKLLKEGKYLASFESYTEALKVDPLNKKLNAVLYSNRAVALMKLKKFSQALTDCNLSIECDETYAKSYLRRGNIKEELDDHENAVYDY